MNSVPDSRQRWDDLFVSVPPEWKLAPPSDAMRRCLSFFLDYGVANALDVGCGIGRWSLFLARHDIRVKAADFSANAIRFARGWAAEENLNIEFACRAITEQAFPGELFEGAIAALVLDSVPREEMTLAIAVLRSSLAEAGCLFALFNPAMTDEEEREELARGNPTAGFGGVRYTDGELSRSFPGFEIQSAETFERGTRAYCLIKCADVGIQRSR